jgi:two-component system response regulator
VFLLQRACPFGSGDRRTERADRSNGMNSRNEEILLVEDDPADAELTLMAIGKEKLTANIHVARDGAEALDFIFCRGSYSERKFDRPPKLILLDLKLPKISGHQVLRAIKSDPRTRSIPVVVLTSSHQDRDLVECYRSGTNSYIQKPVDLQKFQETVRNFSTYWLRVNQPPPMGAFIATDSGAKP